VGSPAHVHVAEAAHGAGPDSADPATLEPVRPEGLSQAEVDALTKPKSILARSGSPSVCRCRNGQTTTVNRTMMRASSVRLDHLIAAAGVGGRSVKRRSLGIFRFMVSIPFREETTCVKRFRPYTKFREVPSTAKGQISQQANGSAQSQGPGGTY
jgi:hypothetical protein